MKRVNILSKSLNCGVYVPYRKEWAWVINGNDYILMRAEIPLHHLCAYEEGALNRWGAEFYANMIIEMMFSNLRSKQIRHCVIEDDLLISEWFFCQAAITEEHLVIYYFKQVMFEVDRMYNYEGLLKSDRDDWKKYFLEREFFISYLRSQVMEFGMSERIYSYYANAFEFAFQVPDIIDDVKEEDWLYSNSDLMKRGLLLGDKSLSYTKKLLNHRKFKIDKHTELTAKFK
jgi:hypothetical protein